MSHNVSHKEAQSYTKCHTMCHMETQNYTKSDTIHHTKRHRYTQCHTMCHTFTESHRVSLRIIHRVMQRNTRSVAQRWSHRVTRAIHKGRLVSKIVTQNVAYNHTKGNKVLCSHTKCHTITQRVLQRCTHNQITSPTELTKTQTENHT